MNHNSTDLAISLDSARSDTALKRSLRGRGDFDPLATFRSAYERAAAQESGLRLKASVASAADVLTALAHVGQSRGASMGELFDDLNRDGETGLAALVTARQQENVQLDFKSKADARHGSPNDDDKRTLAEALSGFANSAGGLLIWGVDARKGPDGVDCAQSLLPIAQIERFSSAITGLIGQLVMPRLEGVRTAIVPASVTPSLDTCYLMLIGLSGDPIVRKQKGKIIHQAYRRQFFRDGAL